MRKILLILLLSSCNLIYAQTIYWADTVIDFSSQLSPQVYSANQALGEPNVALGEGDSPNAWAASRPDREEFLILGFTTPIRAQQIAVHESFNPGAITKILLYDKSGDSHEVYSREPRQDPRVSRVLNVYFPLTSYEVTMVEIQLDGSAVEGINCIDAVAIAGTNNPVQVSIPVMENANPDLEVNRLDQNVNSDYDEAGPVMSPDGRILFFSRFNHPDNIGGVEDDEDIWFSVLNPQDNTWSAAQNIGAPLNNKYANYVNSASRNGDHIDLLLGNEYTKGGKVRPGLSISNNADSAWSFPVPFPVDQFYTLSSNSEYMLSYDGNILLMSIEQEDSRGLVDIYVSTKNSEGAWSAPINLGPTINTAHEELSPMLVEDNRTLYFASAGHGGFGGTDILVSERLDDSWTNWSKPKNMGPGVNTKGDEVHMSIHSESNMGFFAREVDGNTDIFQFDKEDLYVPPKTSLIAEIETFDAKTRAQITSTFRVEEETGRSQYNEVANTRPQEKYSIELSLGKTFRITASAQGYLSETIMLDLTGENISTEDRSFLLQLQPEPPAEVVKKVEEKVELQDITFQHNSSYLTEESVREIIALSEMLKEKSLKAIELTGHTDNTGDEAYNLWMSERRVKRVSKMFVRFGVDESLIQVKWFGESIPKYPNDNPEDRERNRRVEIRIIE